MELYTVYGYELDGRKHYFATNYDRNYALNKLPHYKRVNARLFIIALEP